MYIIITVTEVGGYNSELSTSFLVQTIKAGCMIMSEERELLPTPDRPPPHSPIQRGLFFVFAGLSFITFQYVPPVKQDNDNAPRRCCTCKKRLCSLLSITYLIIGTIIIGGIAVNLGPFIVFLIDWIKCPLVYHNMCFIFEFHSSDLNNTEIPEILMRDLSDDGKTYYKDVSIRCHLLNR